MKLIRFAVLVCAITLALADTTAAVRGRRANPNQVRPATNLPNLPNPFRGTVENVTPDNVVVVGDKGPTGTFVIQRGAKIQRDGKEILPQQIFKGDPILVKFTVVKETGLMQANEIWVGSTLPNNVGTTRDEKKNKAKKKQGRA